MADLEPITRDEKLWSGEDLEPITRREMYIKHLYDETQVVPDKPITREEMFILKAGEELHDVTIEQLNVTQNGTYSEQGKAFSPVIVEVPQITTESLSVTDNGTYTAPSGKAYNEVNVALPLDDKTITANGTYKASDDSLKGYDEVVVDVPLPQNAYLDTALSGLPQSIASFNDGQPLPLSNLKVDIEAVQSGSGDPSPSNVRPISGHTEANVTRCGKNLFDENFADWEVIDSYLVLKDKLPSNVELNMSFTDNDTSVDLNGIYLGFISNYTGGAPVTYRWIVQGNNIGSSKSNLIGSVYCNQLFIYPNNEATFNKIKQRYNIQVEIGTTATTYEAYNGNTYSITFPSEAGTVYGGTLDVVNGVLTVDRVIMSGRVTSLSSNTYSNIVYGTIEKPNDSKNKGNTEVHNLISSMYPVSPIITGWDNADNIGKMFVGASYTQFWIGFPLGTTLQDAQTETENNVLCYELATPQTYQLTPTAIKSLLGNNNIFADCGDVVELSYWSKGGISI